MKTPKRSFMKHFCKLPFTLTLTQSLLLTLLLIFQLIQPEASYSQTQPSEGFVVGWGNRVITAEPNADFTQITAGSNFNAGVRSDGSVVAWAITQTIRVMFRKTWSM